MADFHSFKNVLHLEDSCSVQLDYNVNILQVLNKYLVSLKKKNKIKSYMKTSTVYCEFGV